MIVANTDHIWMAHKGLFSMLLLCSKLSLSSFTSEETEAEDLNNLHMPTYLVMGGLLREPSHNSSTQESHLTLRVLLT